MSEVYIDRISAIDNYKEEPIRYNHRNGSLFKTRIKITDYNGDEILSIKRKDVNMTVLGGRLSVLEKVFGITPKKSQRLLISDLIPKPTATTSGDHEVLSMDSESTYQTLHTKHTIYGDGAVTGGRLFKDKVRYFCIGNGGENPNVAYAILDVHDWETRLYNMVPFRCVPISNDLTTTERANYRLRKQIEIDGAQYYAYYLKVFDPGTIKSMKSDAEYTPTSKDSSPYIGSGEGHPMKGHVSEIYTTFDLEISQIEFKEFYRALHNDTLTGARLTELGLVSGYDAPAAESGLPGVQEVYDPTLFAKLVHEPVFLSTEGSRRKVTYSVFA